MIFSSTHLQKIHNRIFYGFNAPPTLVCKFSRYAINIKLFRALKAIDKYKRNFNTRLHRAKDLLLVSKFILESKQNTFVWFAAKAVNMNTKNIINMIEKDDLSLKIRGICRDKINDTIIVELRFMSHNKDMFGLSEIIPLRLPARFEQEYINEIDLHVTYSKRH